MTGRMKFLLFALACVLVITALLAFRYMVSQRNAALAAWSDLEDCLSMASQVEQLSRRPALAAEHEKLASEVTGLIENAARAAEITPQSLSRITPESPRRIGDTVYKEKPTQVLLRRVTLKQLVTLTHSLISSDAGLHAKFIRLSVPREQDSGDLWTSELVLTYLIYDPPKSEKQGAFE